LARRVPVFLGFPPWLVMEKKWGEWERNGSVAAAPNPKTSAPIGPQLAMIESWPEPAPPLEPLATSVTADSGQPHRSLEELSKERGTLRGQHPSCKGVTMVSFSAAVRSCAAAPVFGVGKERIVATAIWQPDATALDLPAPAVFLYSAQAVHTAAMTSGGNEMTWRSCKDKLRKWIKANRGGFWMPPDREPKAGSVVAAHSHLLTLSHSQTLTLSHSVTLILSHSLTLALSHSQTLALSHTLTLTLTLALAAGG